MRNSINKERAIAAIVLVSVLLVFGTLFYLTTPSSKSKIKSSNTVAKKSAPPSTILSPTPTTALPSARTPYGACKALIGNIVDKNYKQPTLNPAVIKALAVPQLAQAILATPHMTPGEIAQQEVLTPSIVGGNMASISHGHLTNNSTEASLSVGSPVNLSMYCYAQKTSSGSYIVTKLVKD